MTKKHFEAIAQTLAEFAAEAPSTYERNRVRSMAGDLASKFEAMNPRFDRDTFMTAIFGQDR